MNPIIGISQVKLEKEDLPEEHVDVLEKIYSSGNSLLGIINDILDMSKIETGKLDLNPAEFDVPRFLNDTILLNVVRIGEKRIEFLLEVEENLPSKLFGDELRIKQILNNLLSNAIKYTDKGFVKLAIESCEDGDGVIMHFRVEDTGQGLSQEDQARLFSEYLRFNADANRATEGTGLGLTITKKLAEMMDGTIGVDSEYGKGSVFYVTIRLKAVECDPIGSEKADELCNFMYMDDRQIYKPHVAHEPMPYGSVLVVDDVDINLYVAEGVLEPYKLNIELVDSGFKAIEKFEGGKVYDIIFMDHMMPKMDGIATTEKLRAMGYPGAIIALTANALVGNEEMFAQHGFDGYIPKPIDVRSIETVLNKFVRDRHPEEAARFAQAGETEADE